MGRQQLSEQIGGALSGYDDGTKDVLEQIHDRQRGRSNTGAGLQRFFVYAFVIGWILVSLLVVPATLSFYFIG